MKRTQQGFTLIELMIVIAIIGVLASVAMPAYQTYTKRAKFTEVVLATTKYKTPIEIAVQAGRGPAASYSNGTTTLEGMDAGVLGIPANTDADGAVGQYVASVSVADGVITATGNDQVDEATYVVIGQYRNGGVQWNVSDTQSSCMSLGLC